MATTDVNEDKVISAYREKVARDKLIENLTANVLINELFENPEGKVIPAAVVPQNSTGTVNSNAPVLGVSNVPYVSGGISLGNFVPSTDYEYVYKDTPYAQRDASGTVKIGQKAIPRSLDVSYCIETEVSPSDGKGHTVEMISTLDADFYGEKLMERYDETVKGKVADKTVVRVSATAAFKLGLMDTGIFWNSDKTACVRRVAFVVETPILARDVKSADEIMAEMNKE